MNTLTVKEYLEYKILEKKIEDQIITVLRAFSQVRGNINGDYEGRYLVELTKEKAQEQPWPPEMYIFGDKYYRVCVFLSTGGPKSDVIEFPIAYMFMNEENIKKDIQYTFKNTKI